MASWNQQAIFDPGPHRVVLERSGRAYLPPMTGDNFLPTTLDMGKLEVRLVQTGRLVAANETALWQAVDVIQAIAEGEQAGTLRVPGGKSWTQLRMMRFFQTGPVLRGRVASVPYEILYIQVGV